MRILTEYNRSFPMDNIPQDDNDLRFCVLDYTNPSTPDYYFLPLVFLESFNSAAASIQIGKYRIQMPWDWSLIIGDPEVGDLEVIKLEHCMDRDFHAFSYNPLGGFKHDFLKIEVTDIYPDVRWYVPKLKSGHILTIPLTDGDNPSCVFMVKETGKIPDVLMIGNLV